MAFPTIPTAAAGRVLTSTDTTAATSTFPDLSSLTKNAGDLLIAICVVYQSTAAAGAVFGTWGGGFTEFVDQRGGTTQMSIGAAYKFSTGSETGTFTVTVGATVTGHSAMILLSIPGAHASTPPEGGTIATGTTAVADPVALVPSWGAADTLWAAVAGAGETATGGAFQGVGSSPTNYSTAETTGISSDVVGGVAAGVGFRQLNTASEDVGPWTGAHDVSNARNVALVIAVRPAAAAAHDRSAAVDAAAAVTVAATQFFSIFEAAAVVAATGAVASSGEVVHVHSRSAAVSATGDIASSGEFETPAASHERSATLEATGAATVAAFSRDHQRQSAVAASGAVATAGQRDLLRSATVTATGAVATQAIRVHIRSTDVSASGTVTSTGQRDLLRAVALAATADIFTSGQIEGQLTEHNRSADLTATASIDTTAVFWTTFERTVALTATATTDTAGLGILERSAGLEATGAISSTGSLQLERAVAVSATALIETTVSAVEWSYGPLEGWSYQGGTASMYQGGTAFNYGPGQGWTYHGGD
jgi:hypothetical protein